MKYLIYIFFTFCFLNSFAQNKQYQICDSASRQSLPSASIKFKGTNNGTMANEDGKFSLNTKKGIIRISYIGYKTAEINLGSIPDTIFLAEDNLLTELIVMPDSSLKVLLRNAYNNIETNYPQKPSYLTGFYREILHDEDKNVFEYFTEAFLKIYKPSYIKSSSDDIGQVKIIKSRTVKNPLYEQSGIKYIGGPFISINLDYVQNRFEILNPKDFKKFIYKLESISKYDGQEIYIVNITKKDSSEFSKIYINKSDLAYIKIERFVRNKSKWGNLLDSGKNYMVDYSNFNGLWSLSKIDLKIERIKKKGTEKHFAYFLNTNSTFDSLKVFKYDDQLLLNEVIADSKNDVSKDFFDRNDTFLNQDDKLKKDIESIFKLNTVDSLRKNLSDTIKNARQSKNIFKYLLKVYRSNNQIIPNYSIYNFPLINSNNNIVINTKNLYSIDWSENANFKINNTNVFNDFYWITKFTITKRVFLSHQFSSVLESRVRINQREVGVYYTIALNRAKKPIYIEPYLKYSTGLVGLDFGYQKNPERKKIIANVQFNAKNINTLYVQRNSGLKLGVDFNFYSFKVLKGTVPFKTYFSINYFDLLKYYEPFYQIREKREFSIFEKKVNIPITDSRLIIDEKMKYNLPKLQDGLSMGLSMRIAF